MTNLNINLTNKYEMGNSTVYDYDITLNQNKIGYAEVVTDDDYNVINDIYIEDNYQNKGFGTMSIKEIVKEFGEIILAPTNEDNQRLYERLGEEASGGNLPEIDQGYGIYEIY